MSELRKFVRENGFRIDLWTLRDIGSAEDGERFFRLLERYDLWPDRIGLYEPIRDPLPPRDYDKAVKYWLDRDCMFKRRAPRACSGMVSWGKNWPRGRKLFNWIILGFPPKLARQELDRLLQLADDLYELLQPVLIQASADFAHYEQWEDGKPLDTRLPGVQWLNFFGPIYCQHIGRERLSAAGTAAQDLPDGGMLVRVGDDPFAKCFEDPRSPEVMRFKHTVGLEWFAETEPHRVPPFDFSHLWRPEGMQDSPPPTYEPVGPLASELDSCAASCEQILRAALGDTAVLDWSPGSLDAVEELLHRHRRANKHEPLRRCIGWYFGEVVRRHLGGKWEYRTDFRTWAIHGVGGPDRFIFPFAKIEKLREEKQQNGLRLFFEVLQRER